MLDSNLKQSPPSLLHSSLSPPFLTVSTSWKRYICTGDKIRKVLSTFIWKFHSQMRQNVLVSPLYLPGSMSILKHTYLSVMLCPCGSWTRRSLTCSCWNTRASAALGKFPKWSGMSLLKSSIRHLLCCYQAFICFWSFALSCCELASVCHWNCFKCLRSMAAAPFVPA